MRPEHPEARNLRREAGELFFHRSNNSARATVPREEGWRVLTLDRVERVARYSVGEEASVDIQQC